MIKTRLLTKYAAMALLSTFALAACDDEETPIAPEVEDIVATAEAAGSFNTLLAALDATNLRSTLTTGGPFTVFAPTDAAFAALPAGTLDALLADPDALAQILLYHVVDGDLDGAAVTASAFIETLNGQSFAVSSASGLTVDGANVVSADIEATNGRIHVIDQVILPSDLDIVEIALGNDAFETLVAALQAADLVTALQGDGPFTVFAPTDDAFAALPAGVLDALLANPSALAEVLTYHVVPGRLLSPDVVSLQDAATLNGASIQITVEQGAVRVDAANVVTTDIQGTNGVIHVIDEVILPEGFVVPS